LNEPSAVRALRIDDMVATYVVGGVLVVWPAELLPKVPVGHWSGNEGLLDVLARMVMSVGDQPFGRVVTSAAGRVWEPVHTPRRAPAPRTFI
jgi:hypothetical protein